MYLKDISQTNIITYKTVQYEHFWKTNIILYIKYYKYYSSTLSSNKINSIITI